MRAMVLAAGLGTRLRPLTLATPKPLLPIANRPLLEYTFALLAAAGVDEVIVNAHHLAGRLQDGLRSLDSSGLSVHCSVERRLLGTAGGVRKAGTFLESGTFFLLNGDFLIDMDLRRVLDFHREHEAMATMVLVREESPGVISVDAEGMIRRFLKPAEEEPADWIRAGFTGIHVLEPEVLKLMPANRPWEINRQVYPEMLARGRRVCGYLHRGYWREAGSPSGYLAANLEVLSGRAGRLTPRLGAGTGGLDGASCTAPLLAGSGIRIGSGVVLGPEVVLGKQVRIGSGARLSRSVILEGTDIPAGARIDREVWFPEGRFPHDAAV